LNIDNANAWEQAHKPFRKGRAPNSLVSLPQSKVSSEELDKPDEQPNKDRAQTPTKNTDTPQIMMDLNTIAEKAARAAQSAIQGFDMNQAAAGPHYQISQRIQLPPSQPPDFHYQFAHQPTPASYYHGSPYQPHAPGTHHQMSHPSIDMNNEHDPYGDHNNIPCQTLPTHALYERARMAETSKASPSTRRAGHPSQRRPWSTQEEAALLDGLDRVKGPHWSQILAMYGAGGSVSEALKDRNQVQLKDKARNFKLYFLKNNIQLPYSLSLVTGELRTRAPAQAAKNEAEVRERQSEEHGYVEGAMTVAPGLSDTKRHAANAAGGHAGNRDGYEDHSDGNDINIDQADPPNTEETPTEETHNHLQQRSRVKNDIQYDSIQSSQNEVLETCVAEPSKASLHRATRQQRLVHA
jgi:hypothetical protein